MFVKQTRSARIRTRVCPCCNNFISQQNLMKTNKKVYHGDTSDNFVFCNWHTRFRRVIALLFKNITKVTQITLTSRYTSITGVVHKSKPTFHYYIDNFTTMKFQNNLQICVCLASSSSPRKKKKKKKKRFFRHDYNKTEKYGKCYQ